MSEQTELETLAKELLAMVWELRRALWEDGAPEGPEEWKALEAVRDLTSRAEARLGKVEA